ncbi:ThiF family adenylyltransferase [Chitinophaga pendula]|uniref:HesA/MoeB/ThiF family protein n=1 Tax=Chitinophaga TaxID=79328 RepID=UPI000BAF8656|nr:MULTISPECIES: ThiF family adenylyltransferase [Chitinophaga]ASZ09535.1 hypothetical protein CK934_00350 [Chitinophaga sp. MD30]UCJ07531.1 ThiF family adenylyltransferase [Chitinophaga pendula]
MALSERELDQFKYPIAVPGIGVDMQEKIRNSRILVIGAGGLGAPILQYLGAMGVGVVVIADYAVITAQDMHRQQIYQMQDRGKHKAKMAASRLWATNPFTKYFDIVRQVKPENVEKLLQGIDFVIDCSQHGPTHLMVNDACIVNNKPFIIGEVHNWVAWYAGFNIAPASGEAPASYRCSIALADEYRNFDAGALGSTHATTALMIVNEVLKYLIDVPGGLANKFHSRDFLHNRFEEHNLVADPAVITATKAQGVLSADEYQLDIVPDPED